MPRIINKTRVSERNGRPWTVNECLQLQREYELLELPINEIARRHKRTSNAIMFKLDSENLADYNSLFIATYPEANVVVQPGTTQSYYHHIQDEIDDSITEDSSSPGNINLKNHMIRIEKQLHALTQLILNQNKSQTQQFLFSN